MSQPIDWSRTAGPKLYDHAKKRIPGGTQLLSKRPEMFLPDQWPTYYTRASGCSVWDLDGREFVDMTTTGIGACLLGYADEDVNSAVKQSIDAGTLTTLNAPVEVELADLLCELHPWAQMVRYARSGGESMAVAVRIARASTGRDVIAFCGYHGWSDWYIAANLSSDRSLDGHLLPGLDPAGVPRGLAGTALPFRYNQIDELKSIIQQQGKNLAAVVMEPLRYDPPAGDFLHQVRELAHKAGAVLVFDEITCGWRNNLGGAHLMFGVEPDMAVFAKSTSNGFPFAAIIGREKVMQAAQSSFISSTYWTEAMGPTAALATIKKMRRIDLPKLTTHAGERVREGWEKLNRKHGLEMKFSGRPALSTFTLNFGPKTQAIKTLLTQSMLDRGYLANTAFYATSAHSDAIIDRYLSALDETFGELKQAIDKNDVESRLRGPIAHSGFQRLT